MSESKLKFFLFLLCLSLVATMEYNGNKIRTKRPTTSTPPSIAIKPQVLERHERSRQEKQNIESSRQEKQDIEFENVAPTIGEVMVEEVI